MTNTAEISPPTREDASAPLAGIAVDDLRAPHRAHVLVCTDPWRDGCAAKGSLAIVTRLRRELRDRGLRMEVRASRTYCQGWCARGPNVIVEPQGAWYERVAPADVPDIVEQHLLRGRAVTRLLRRDYGVASPPPPAGEASISATAAGGGFPRTLTDGLGRRVAIADQPRRVGAVSPGADAILRALLPPDCVVDAAGRLTAPRTAFAGVRFLLADHDIDPATVAAADAAGIPLVALHRPQYVTYIQANIGLAARAVGAEPRAAELNAAIDARLDANRAAAPPGGRPRTVFYSPDGTAAGPYSFANSLISAAGGQNPVPTSGPGRDEAVPLPVDALAALEPDVVLLRVTRDFAARDTVDALLGDARFAGTPAARSGRVHVIDLGTYGGRLRSHEVLDVLADIHRLLYPEPSGRAPSSVQPSGARP